MHLSGMALLGRPRERGDWWDVGTLLLGLPNVSEKMPNSSSKTKI